MYTVVIAEDEPLAGARLQRFLCAIDDVAAVYVAKNGMEAMTLVQEYQPELLILDINMPAKSGLTVAKELQNSQLRSPAIIFTTAYDEHALEAFAVNAVAYLMKPIQEQELKQAVVRAGQLNLLQVNEVSSVEQKSLMLKRSASIESLKVSDIAYFRAADKLVLAGLLDCSETIIDQSLKDLEEKLAPAFFRVHRHTLINLQYVHRINRNSQGSGCSVYLSTVDKSFDVSRRQVSMLRKKFLELHA